ncbi:hypothetical protein KUCAC02_029767 [Chaenocephalus aceratus]|nr:hypothetical protein KUCAC02_029767 [Chaenocephalus aceratus]
MKEHICKFIQDGYQHQFERPAPDERPAPVRPATSQAGTPHLASPSSRSEHLEATQDFTHTTILLLLDLTETHQHTNRYNIRKKLNHLLTTYKRAKDRCTSTGEGNITWEYYGIMDNLFGRCGVGSAPPGTLASTPLFPTASQPSTTLPCASEAQPGPSTTLPTTLPCASEAQPGPSMTLPTTLPCASEAQPGPSMTLPTTLPCASEAQPGPSMTLPTTLPCASEAQPGPSMTLPTTLLHAMSVLSAASERTEREREAEGSFIELVGVSYSEHSFIVYHGTLFKCPVWCTLHLVSRY